MNTVKSLSRRLAARVPLVASLLGMMVAFTSVVFFFGEDDVRRPIGVALGFGFVLLAIWYAAHPFLKNERDYPELRREVVKFVDLAKELHYAAMLGDDAAFESIEARIPAQVAIVVETARKSRSLQTQELGLRPVDSPRDPASVADQA